ncbi:MAG: porin family protein, partial [Bauldia sp.]
AYVGLNVGGGFKADNSFGGDVSGVVGGGQIGYNYQISPLFVVGLETDFQGTSLRSNNGFGNASLPWFGTVRGRAGFALLESKLFVYGTGGFAYGELNTPFGSDTRTGWTAGGGVEWAFLPNWSAKVEYLYVDLGRGPGFWSNQFNPVGALTAFSSNQVGASNRFHTVKVGLNYHFNLFGSAGPVLAKY